MKFPMPIADIPLFEEKNNLCINVYSYDNYLQLFPPYTTQKSNVPETNILLIYTDAKHHYCWIRDLRRFITGDNESSFCHYCLTHFRPGYQLHNHQRLCKKHGRQVVKMPSGNRANLTLAANYYTQKVAFVIYADFECILELAQQEAENMSDNEDQKVLSIHKPCGYAYKIVGPTRELSKDVKFFRGEDAAEKFVLALLEEETWIKKKLSELPYSRKNWIPVVFHNGNRYDSHLIVQVFKKVKDTKQEVQFGCLPVTVQEFISFNIGTLQFIDSYRFLKEPLATLVNNLEQSYPDDEERLFKNTSELTKDMIDSKEKLKLLLRKQIYPYEYMDSHDKFNQTSLPAVEHFYSRLHQSSASDEEYNHTNKVWETFNIKTLGDYHDLYIQTDVLLLADVFENFRTTMLDHYNLDPAHFYSIPRLAWEAALKTREVRIELLTDLDMYLMIESGIRGGVSMVSRRYSKANNPKVPDFDQSKPKTWIIYLDANNLNGWAMTQPLPNGNFKWLTDKEIKALKVQNIYDNADTGYILEVDLEYPEELHNEHNDFPLASEKVELTSEMLSPYCKKLFKKLDMKEPKEDRLIPNLRNKEKYVVHYRTLKLYLNLGMKLTKTHRVLSFRQTAWLKPYIDFNTQRRRESTNDVQKDFFKLMNNCVYGKTIENMRNYDKEVEFLFRDSDLAKAKMRPNFQNWIDVHGTKIVQNRKTSLYLNEPIFAGFVVLDLAKLFIYDFHYNRIRVKYGDKAKLLFTDTDSLCYEIETEDIYDDMKYDDEDLYDFSKYPKDHPLFNDQNQNVLGKMKDETCGVPIEEFVGLKPKMYSLKYGDSGKKTAVGVAKDYANKHIKHSDYHNCLTQGKQMKGEITRIESVDHQLRTDNKGLQITNINIMESSPAKKPRMEKTYLPTPKWLKQQESIVNVKNEDNQCFKWSILAALNPVTGDAADDVASYTSFENNLNFDELNFPILIKDIPKFEENNKNFSVNIYSCEKKHVLPTIKSMAVNKKEINLLRITSRGKQHYCWIKDLQIFLNANSESSHLPTPKWLQKTKSIVNVKNYDNQCFKWSILAALHPVNGDVAEDVSSYTSFEKDLKFCELNFPISIKDIPKFEENNNNICVNVYVVQNETLGTAYTSQVLNKMEINLLLISCKGKQHYCWIKDLGSVLFANPGSSYIPTPGWLKRKESIVNVKNNDEECFKWSILAALHPAQIDAAENVSSYTSFENELSFNEMNIPISLKDIPKFEKNNNLRISVYSFVENKRIFLAYTGQGTDEENINLLLIWEKKRQHFCWIKDLGLFLTGDGESSYCQYCLGQNIFQPDFPVEDHKRLCKKHGYQAIELPSKEKNVFNKQTPFEASEISFVIYAHIMCFTGKYQSEDVKMSGKNQNVISVHSPCGYAYKVVGPKSELSEGIKFYRGENAAEKFVESLIKEETSIKEKLTTMKDSRKRWIPVIMHNLKKCHSHMIIQAFNSIHEKDGDVKFGCLTSSLQKFVCFSVGYLQFIDSSSFLDSPLATLVNNLQQSFNDKAFQNTSKLTEGRNDKLKLLLKKCVYPYDYMDSEDKFNNQFLPTMEEFNSKLLDRVVTKEDYNHAVNVWRIFDIESLGGYHDLYIKTHVLLLADVFENFRKTMLQYYNIDPARGYSTPWLSWQAALKMTRTELELLTDVSMHLVIESGIRGGVAMLSKRYAKGNNPNVPGYDEKQPTTWIIYLDANNLYGWAMSQPLPTRNFKWLNEEDIKYLDVQNIDDNADTGYILEVDLEYPEELHNEHNDFPLAPEKIELTSEMLSPYCKKLFEELGMKEPTGDRLIPNLRNKEKYVVHYRTLKLYLKLGLVLTKVHRVISFKQTSWLKPYINFNTDRRKQSNSEVQKDFFKLMNNSVYGKTAEKVRKYNKEVKFVFSDTELDEAKKRPDFQDFIDVNGMKIVMYKKVSVLLDQPIFVGFTVLDLAKAFIYDFHYNHMRARYGDRAQLLFTDTDSLCYEVETKNIYNDLNDMNQKKDLFDFSNYIDKKHPLFNNRNKNVVGKMKEETCGVPIEEFVGLNPKMYTLKYGGKEIKKAKGVPAEFKDEHITFEDYKKCFTEDQQMKGEITKMKSLNHQLRTVKETRVTLSPYDDKRFIFKDGIHSRAYGHFIIPRED